MSDSIKVPFLDLSREFEDLSEEWMSAIHETGKAGSYIGGSNVQAFEKEVAGYVGDRKSVV